MDAGTRPGAVAWLWIRSAFWMVLVPGSVTFTLPWLYFGLREAVVDWSRPDHLVAVVLIAAGATILIACIWEFARSGRGTLAPIDPPTELVIGGFYRFVRNPMYLGAAVLLAGEVLLTRSRSLAIFAAIWFTLVNLFVIGYEEPKLRRQFGDSYRRYTERVGRWIPGRPSAP